MDPQARAAWSEARPGRGDDFAPACRAPWVSLEFDPAGWVYACCTSLVYPLGRIGEQRLDELWNGPRAQVLRESLERWDLTVACNPCRWHLEHGRTDPVAAVYDQYPVADATPDAPYMMLFALSNRCNLGCVMCSPALSSRLAREAGMSPGASRYDDTFFADLEPLLGGLHLAKFLGGEPFLAPEHHRVWDLMRQLDRPPRVQVTTNGTVWTPLVESVLDSFAVDVSISVDAATAETFAAVRRGGDFSQLVANVDRFDAYCRERGTDLHVSFCLMTENWRELGAFLRWAERFPVPASVNLVTNRGLALHDLTLEELESVRRHWQAEDATLGLDRNEATWRTQLVQLDHVIAERRSGTTPGPRQALPMRPDDFAAGPGREPCGSEVLQGHLDRLARWSTDGVVAQIVAGPDDVVVDVPREHPALGLTCELLAGRRLTDLPRIVEVADGRRAFLLDGADLPDGRIRTMVLTHEIPVRGTPGVVVRTIDVATDGGRVLLAAQDRSYDDRPEPVAIRPRAVLGGSR